MAFGNAWGGGSVNGTIVFGDVDREMIWEPIPLSAVTVINNVSRVSRLLVRFRLETSLTADDIEGDLIPWPVDLGVMYTPQPDNEGEWHPGQLGAGASWRETVMWRPQSVSRTGVPSTKWWAAPEVTRTTQMQRIIHDRDEAHIWLGFGYTLLAALPAENYVAPDVTGWMTIDYLLSNVFI